MSKGDHDARRDSMNSYISPGRSAQGTPGRHYTQTQYNDAIRPQYQQQMSAQPVGSPSSAQGTPGRPYSFLSYHMSPMTGTSPAINMATAAVSGGEYTINAYPHQQPAREPQPFFVDKLGRPYTEAQFKEAMRLQQQRQMNAQPVSMNTQNGQQFKPFQLQQVTQQVAQQVSQQPSQPLQSATQAKPFMVGKDGRHYTREEAEQYQRHHVREFGHQYFAALSPEDKQRFQQLQPQQQYQVVYQELVRRSSPKAQPQQKQQPQQQHQQHARSPQPAPRQQPAPQHQQPYASPAITMQNIPDQGIFDKNGTHYTKEEVRALIKRQQDFRKQQKEQQIAAAAAAHRTQVQVPTPESSGGTPKASLIGGEQPGSVSAAHMNKLSGHGAGTKRSLPDSDSAHEDGRSPKAAMILKASDPQCSSTGGAATGPMRKVAATKRPKSQDATPHKKPRGRPPKDPETNGTLAKQVSPMDAPAVPAPASNNSKADAHEVVDLTQPEKTKPVSNSPHSRTAEASMLPIGVDIGQPAVHQLWLHSHHNGVSMADIEVGSSIRDNMTNYLSELESHRRISVNCIAKAPSIPLFTDNTMSTEHAKALGLPIGFDMLPILDKVRGPNYDGYATYSGNGNGDFSGIPHEAQEMTKADAEALAAPLKGLGMPNPNVQSHWGLRRDGPMTEPCDQLHWDLPEEVQMTEESALLRWGMLQQAKNRDNDNSWGADMNGRSTWN